MNDEELEYLKRWYIITLNGRLKHLKNSDIKCYIFKNKEDMLSYCLKNNMEYKKRVYITNKDEKEKSILNYQGYILIIEENIEVPLLVGWLIREVHLISSYYYDLVKKMVNEDIERGFDVILKEENNEIEVME